MSQFIDVEILTKNHQFLEESNIYVMKFANMIIKYKSSLPRESAAENVEFILTLKLNKKPIMIDLSLQITNIKCRIENIDPMPPFISELNDKIQGFLINVGEDQNVILGCKIPLEYFSSQNLMFYKILETIDVLLVICVKFSEMWVRNHYFNNDSILNKETIFLSNSIKKYKEDLSLFSMEK